MGGDAKTLDRPRSACKALPMWKLLAALCLSAVGATAQQPDPMEVDVELALMVDVSRSMLPHELRLQRLGYAEALRSPNVFSAIEAGLLGKVAITYVEWSGSGTRRVVVPWTLIETPQDAEDFAKALEAPMGRTGGRTSISGAISFAVDAIEHNGFEGLRKVIDVSGDGPNNVGRGVVGARNAAIERGIIINGLPLMTRDGAGTAWHIDHLDRYYRDCVIGGPGAFVIPVHNWTDLAQAVRQKIVLELANAGGGLTPAQAPRTSDCQIGEKMWEAFRRTYGSP